VLPHGRHRHRGHDDASRHVLRDARELQFRRLLQGPAIPYAWELLTEAFGIDGDRLWITVYETDDEAADIWRDAIGIPAERIQRMGEDNFWEMGETGPCGPCSEIYYDKGDVYGAPGGPLTGGAERFVEIWNLVFMQFNRQLDGSMEPLPRPSIDTVRDSSGSCPSSRGPIRSSPPMCSPPRRDRQSLTGITYGGDDAADVGLRILADHGRAMTMLVSDGCCPRTRAAATCCGA